MKTLFVGKSGQVPIVPADMGVARADQLQGAWFEQLAELCGRICYDSLGRGRSSVEYHKHILEVGHLSVYEHCVFCFVVDGSLWQWFVNRPSLHIEPIGQGPSYLHITCNLRHILENRGGPWETLRRLVGDLASVMTIDTDETEHWEIEMIPVPTPWTSYYFECSRNCSHELVRHGDWTAISQESTRYVDSSEAQMEWHPLLTSLGDTSYLEKIVDELRGCYKVISEGFVDKKIALKQARGAARGVLPSCLRTRLIMTAAPWQWRHIRSMRVSSHADMEISQLISGVTSYE